MRCKNENNVKAAPTIASLIKKNKRLIEEEVSRETINKFIELLTVYKKHERFLTLLIAICSCEGRAIMSKQNVIIESMLDNKANRDFLVLPIRLL